MLAIVPEKKYSEDNELEYREDVRRRLDKTYQKTGNLTVPFGKSLAFTSAQGQVITFGYNEDGNFTIQQDTGTPFGMASISFVSTVQSDLESSFASLESSLTADFGDLSASFTTIATAFADIETAFATLEVDVEAANDAAAAAATSALAAYASETAAGSSAGAAATSATSASTQAAAAATSASQASTSETNAAGSASTATTQATNAATSASAAGTSAGSASTSATSAATSASNAAGSATSASTSASNAASSETNAGNSATAASTSASTASTQATNAGTSASNAATSASDAATSASAAGGSASAASTSASSAATQATNAGNSATAAQSSSVSARSTAASLFPSTFEQDGKFFTDDAATLEPAELSATFADVSGVGRVVRSTGVEHRLQRGLLTVAPDRTYRLTVKSRILTDATNGYGAVPLVGLWHWSASGYLSAASWFSTFVTKTVADGWFTITGTFTLASVEAIVPGTVRVRAGTVPCYNGSGTSNAVAETAFIRLEDITESLSASGSASAAASSASSASASQSAAASSASAASTSATNAATQASNAATSATQASTSETNAAGSASTASTAATAAAASQSAAAGSATAASGSASTASTQAGNAGTSASAAASSATAAAASASSASSSASTASSQASAASASAASAASSASLAASIGIASINSSPTFADNANATGVPTGWVDWSNGSGTRVTGVGPQPYAFQLAGVAGNNTGIRQVLEGLIAPGWYVIEADAELISGTFVGAGAFLYSVSSGGDQSLQISFYSDADISGSAPGNGSTGKIYRYRKLVQYTHATPSSGWPALYATPHWDNFGSVASANAIKFHRVAIRAASQAEIEARQAKLDLVTANANIATNAAAIVTANASIASTNTTVAANHEAVIATSVNLVPYPSGTARNGSEGISTTAQGWTVTGGSAGGGFLNGYWDPAGGAILYNPWASGYSSGSDRFYYIDIPVSYWGWYTFAFDGYVSNIDPTKVQYYLQALDGSNSWLGEVSALFSASSGRRKLTFNAPSGTEKLRISFRIIASTSPNPGAYADLVLRALQLEQGQVATKFNEAGRIIANEARVGAAEGAIVTANANIASNTSAIATEAASRAAADTSLTARFTSNQKNSQNMLRNSTFRDAQHWIFGSSILSGQTYTDHVYAYIGWSGGHRAIYQDVRVEVGAQYAISGDIYSDSTNNARLYVQFLNEARDTHISYPAVIETFRDGAGWRHVTADSTGGAFAVVPSGAAWARIYCDNYSSVGYATSGGVAFRRIKFERGDYCTAWSEDDGLVAATEAMATATSASSAAATANASIATTNATVSANFTALTPNPNLIKNPTWAKGTDGWSLYNCGNAFGSDVGPYVAGNLTGSGYIQAASPRITGVVAGQNLTVSVNVGGSWTGATVGCGLWCYDASDNYLGNVATVNATSGAGYPRLSATGTLPAGCTSATFWFYCGAINGWALFYKPKVENGSTATVFSDDRTLAEVNASVTTNASAISTLEGAAAVWEVVAAASGGTPARVGLKTGLGGSVAWIDASKIFLGDNTLFEDTYNSFYTESGGKRNRFGGPFPASGDLMEWFGPTSVALNSETKTNGYWAKGSDGQMYYGAGALSTVTAYYGTHNGPAVASRTGAGYVSSGAVTITPVNGTAPFYYRYTMLENPNSISLNATNGVGNNTFSINATIPGAAIWRCNVAVDITDAIGRTTRVIVSDNELYDDT